MQRYKRKRIANAPTNGATRAALRGRTTRPRSAVAEILFTGEFFRSNSMKIFFRRFLGRLKSVIFRIARIENFQVKVQEKLSLGCPEENAMHGPLLSAEPLGGT